MTLPVHVGIEHPSLWLLAGVGFLGFLAGFTVDLYRATRRAGAARTATVLEEATE